MSPPTAFLGMYVLPAEISTVVVPGATSSPHKRQYAELLNLATTVAQNALVDQLIVVRDHNAQNALKRRQLQQMRARLGRGRAKGRHDKLYLLRGARWSSRSPANEAGLLDASTYSIWR